MTNKISHSEIGNNIKKYRQLKGMSQEDLAAKVGYKDRSTIAKLEKNADKLSYEKLQQISQALEVGIIDLIGGFSLDANTTKIPVLGRVAAGIPITAVEEVIDWEEVPISMVLGSEIFGLKIKGDSMAPRIQDGDTVIVRKQNFADDGDIVIVLINGEEGVCKKIRRSPDGVSLISLNNQYAPMFFSNSEVETLPINILGKVIELRAKM